MATTADRVFAGLDPAGQDLARILFLRLIKIGDGTEDTRRRMARPDLLQGLDPGSALPVVDAFTQGRSAWAASRSYEGDLSPAASAFLTASTQQEHRAAKVRRSTVSEWLHQGQVPREPLPTVVAHLISDALDREVSARVVTVVSSHQIVVTAVPSYASGVSEVPLLGDTIGDNFDRTVAWCGDREALVDRPSGRRWTYSQLRVEVDAMAHGLLAAGIIVGRRLRHRPAPSRPPSAAVYRPRGPANTPSWVSAQR